MGTARHPKLCCTTRSTIDRAIDRATAESSTKNIINGHLGDLKLGASDWTWIYKRWHGTVLKLTWVPALVNTAVALLLIWCFRSGIGIGIGVSTSTLNWNPLWPQWAHFTTPAPNHPVIMRMAPLYLMWTTLSTLTTFILTFFLTESFSYWRRTLCEVRRLQRALVNVALLQVRPRYFPAVLLASLPAYQPVHLPNYRPTYLPTHLPASRPRTRRATLRAASTRPQRSRRSNGRPPSSGCSR